MSAVVDASVLVAASTDAGRDGTWAEEILAGGGIVAPHLVLVEATNILRRLERSKELTHVEAGAAHRDLVRLDVHLFPFEPFADRIWELRTNLTSYDAWYVAVAEALDLPLATLDRRLKRAPGPRCRYLMPSGKPREPPSRSCGYRPRRASNESKQSRRVSATAHRGSSL